MNVKNDQGQNTGIPVLDPSTNEVLLYVPDIPKIFGATYGALIIQGIRAPSTSISGEGTFSNFGLANTVISPPNFRGPSQGISQVWGSQLIVRLSTIK